MSKAPGTFDRPRRFYKEAAVAPLAEGFALLLDGRQAHSPKARPIVLPTAPLANMVALEWAAQDSAINYATMPATRLAHTALDGVPAARAETAASVARWAASDVICYFADSPRSLVERQHGAWTPLLDWADRTLGVRLETSVGVVHRAQPAESLARVEALAAALDDFALAGVAFAAALFGSAVLALALRAGRLSAENAIAASRLDETFQEERWGVDPESLARTQGLAADAVMLERWFLALG